MTTILQAKRCTGTQRLAVLQRVVKRLRTAWPDPLLLLRGASPCASPEVMQWSEAQPEGSDGTGLTSNAVFQERAREVVEQAKRASACSGRKGTRFHSTHSQAGPWSRARRGVSKVAVSEHGVNTRFVVTDREQARTRGLSQSIYGARGQAENDSKEHQRSVKSDRTACQRFEANQLRLLLPAAA